METIYIDFNSPSIVGWCPFNETWDKGCKWDDNGNYINGVPQDDEILRLIYNLTKAMDSTRTVIDTSGNFHVVTDIFDIHDYEQNVENFKSKFESMKNSGEVYVTYPSRQNYGGEPYFVSEYGGIWWNDGNNIGWGYGTRPKSKDEFINRYIGLTETLLKNEKICGFCYTQLYDVEQELNGFYIYKREAKFDNQIFRSVNTQIAAIEKYK
ncbi:hypothetical protein IAI10_07490 [Clostridium sp. 19966]|uniref:hypothetical protein n=1 Tax=Clostridium sp. 19966 TaxID=2768166 RepID=UPI0028E06395|nr:hypothetical protein [Clostridium sp. 19966]MDT8716499.1 hypothetical protein [Clostridium sp. 19966]